MPSSTPPSSRAQSGFRNLPNPYALFAPRLVFTTLAPKDAALGPYAHPTTGKPMHLFSLDHDLYYTPFKNDYGPLNLAYTFDACVKIFDRLNIKDHKRKALCLYTSPEPEQKSNLAVIAALYSLIVEHNDPWDAFQPIAHFELLPFRDAGNGINEFGLTAQDVLYGMWKAGKHNLLRLQDFDADEYRYYEKVENGDLNTLGNFVAFASPMDPMYIKERTPPGEAAPDYTSAQKKMLRGAFDKVQAKFAQENVGLVVRLNDELYNRHHFVQDGIEHVDMYFDDGTNPTDDIVREFIQLADETFAKGKKVAVHCKAGLGRTGVLIGAYFIYKFQFTASEAIGFMRVVRPGMVVGPQQRYMQLNQMKWAGWAATGAIKRTEAAESLPSPPTERNVLVDIDQVNDPMEHLATPTRGSSQCSKAGDAVGQPRKGLNAVDVPEDIDDEDIISAALREVKSDAPSPPNHSDSIRGVKRGSGRAPVPQVTNLTPRTSESTPRLIRSSSNASCSSSASELDQRATKRRADAPLPKSGLSSPPPSRDVTPSAEELLSSSFPFIEEGEKGPSTPPRNTVPLAGQAPPTPSTATQRPRSLIPRLGSSQLAQATPSSSRSQSSSSSSDEPEAGPNSSRSKLPTRRLVNTTRGWNPLSRMGIAPE
ncbi:hypothetical protein CcaverHIS002_0404030 [Cutaneotrichosporon cavernicola]|uniref:protein-tyrosine-phosphatase n=1 Tax=Cutaneotrichosporon cavernicola TaxID=279322 RepID=A0AA48QVQ7_9TREE|nr:uncharacterized protein CcaverHIS019_0403980 [Cutaneotrichosporon cavernicola]BEI83799.1 hypothetical protein CcaverHIS002_0404030 [Cutaneotrichosporon cavernicola]BEI91578.1 hypothetical protein CcaverHIS019_0403980 [Cutaneotrichosporon cavernicola]BEI99355.1 hypothetical protein CcaverHIS631_0403980 [Cutaneotrichosporon cavernicola]BEJ07130.1 hypothetical protein CcaverHIS641_0403990 [Cutaneotrichosporon cavernicola]